MNQITEFKATFIAGTDGWMDGFSSRCIPGIQSYLSFMTTRLVFVVFAIVAKTLLLQTVGQNYLNDPKPGGRGLWLQAAVSAD